VNTEETCTVVGDVLGDERHGFVAVLDAREVDANLAGLGWRSFTVTGEATDEVIGETEHGTPVQCGGEIEIGGRVSLLQAIDGYAEILLERHRRTAEEINACSRAEDPATGAPTLKRRGSKDFTVDDAREQAAEELLRASIEALFALPGSRYAHFRRDVSRRFCAEIEAAAGRYLAVAVALLYEARGQQRGRPGRRQGRRLMRHGAERPTPRPARKLADVKRAFADAFSGVDSQGSTALSSARTGSLGENARLMEELQATADAAVEEIRERRRTAAVDLDHLAERKMHGLAAESNDASAGPTTRRRGTFLTVLRPTARSMRSWNASSGSTERTKPRSHVERLERRRRRRTRRSVAGSVLDVTGEGS